MLVRLKKHQLTTTVSDKATSEEVRQMKGVTKKGGSWKKRLFNEGYEPIKEIFNRVTKHHDRYTSPFDDGGTAMLRASLFEEYKQGLDILKDELDLALTSFINNLDDVIRADRKALGGTFDSSDYPSASDIRDKCTIEYSFQSMPNLDGVEVNSFSMKELEKLNEERLQAVIEEASAKPLRDLTELLGKMAEKLNDPKAIFRNSLIENVKEYLSSVKAVNVTDSPEVNEVAAQVEALVAQIETPDALRNDKDFRSAIGKQAMEAIDRIKKVGGRKLKV